MVETVDYAIYQSVKELSSFLKKELELKTAECKTLSEDLSTLKSQLLRQLTKSLIPPGHSLSDGQIPLNQVR